MKASDSPNMQPPFLITTADRYLSENSKSPVVFQRIGSTSKSAHNFDHIVTKSAIGLVMAAYVSSVDNTFIENVPQDMIGGDSDV